MESHMTIGITVRKDAGNKKRGKRNLADQYEKDKVSNYDLLARLGFPEALIGQNKLLGLKENTMQDYIVMTEDPVAARAAASENVYVEKKEDKKNYNIRVEESDDWKHI